MLKGKCAPVTGSTQGLGDAMAERLAAEGCKIALNGFGDPGEIERKRRELETDHDVRALHHGTDVADPGEVARFVAAGKGNSAASTSWSAINGGCMTNLW